MGITDDFGNQVRKQANQKFGIDKGFIRGINEIAAGNGVSSTDLGSVIGQMQILAGLNYSQSIMMRGLDLARIDASDWNRLFPYKFVILSASEDGGYKLHRGLEVTLPLTPQDLQITSQFASVLEVASRGINETHNGLRVKNINFTASTGILITRPTFTLEDKVDSNIQAIFGGTVQAVNGFLNAVSSVFPSSQAQLSDVGSNELIFNGYYQYHAIKAFLELYADLKSKPKGQGYRLGLELGKDRVVYLITPQSFVTKKNAASPMEHIYTFSGVAWGTVTDIGLSQGKDAEKFLGSSTSDIQDILNGLRNVRRVFQSAKDIISAAKTDVETNIFGPINNIILSLKEAASIPQTIADFPGELQKSFQSTIVKQSDTLSSLLPGSLQASFKAAVAPSLAESSNTGSVSGVVVTKASILQDIDFTDAIPVNGITLTPEQQQAVQTAIDNAVNTSNSDLKSLIENIQTMSDTLEDSALTQGIDSPSWDILYSAAESTTHLYALLSDNFFGVATVGQQAAGVNPLIDFYQGYAATGGIEFTKSQSKFAIPFPFKVTLEWLSQKYLGDATRWLEIVAANNLQPPYIDEDGFTRSFLTNGQDRQFNISDGSNLFANQSVWIFSDTKPMQKRRIKAIQKVTDTNFIITVDGESDLGTFTLADKAKMKSYLPNTVNSQKLIYIPIDQPSNFSGVQNTPITFIDESPEMLAMAKVDLLLDQNGDLAVSQDGFQNLAFGKNNLIQAAKIKMKAVAGQLLLHPEFGAGVEVGTSEADFSLEVLVSKIKDSFADDPRFQSVDRVEIQQEPGVVRMTVIVTVADNQGIVPISYEFSK